MQTDSKPVPHVPQADALPAELLVTILIASNCNLNVYKIPKTLRGIAGNYMQACSLLTWLTSTGVLFLCPYRVVAGFALFQFFRYSYDYFADFLHQTVCTTQSVEFYVYQYVSNPLKNYFFIILNVISLLDLSNT